MAHKQDSSYKIKLLILYEILKKETDEDNKLSTKELIAKLAERGINCDRKILYDDIKTLNDYGYEVISERGQQMQYFMPDSGFDDYELRILLDAVQSAKFITEKKTKELEKKIVSLAGTRKSDFVEKNITCINNKKSQNESIFYNVSTITSAIQHGTKITFKYFDLDLNGAKKYRYDGKIYQENPLDLVISEDKYYLIVYNEEHDKAFPYRVDRMDNVNETKIPSLKKKISEAKALRNEAFSMYTGKQMRVTFKFDKNIISQVVDKFGFGLRCEQATDDYYIVTTDVNVSDTFYAWCFTYGNLITILGPDEAVKGYKERLSKVLKTLPKD